MRLNSLNHWQKSGDIYWVGSLTIVGLLLRLPGLNLGLWRDEASTYFNALPLSFGEFISRVTDSELNPPAFFLLMDQWMQWFGTTAVPFKIPALIFGLLLIWSIYLLGREIHSHRVGVVAAAIATFARESIYYSQEARPYTLVALFSCLTVWMYCKALNHPNQKGALYGFVLCATLLLYIQYTGLLLVSSLAVITLYLQRSRKATISLPLFAIAFGAIYLLFLPWLPIFFHHLSTSTPWLEKVSWLMRWDLFLDNLLYPLPFPYGRLRGILKVLIVISFSLWIWQLLLTRSRQSQPLGDMTLPAPIATLVLSVVILTVSVSALSYGGRYLFFFLSLTWVLYSIGCVQLWDYLFQRWSMTWQRFTLRIILGLLILGLLISPNVSYALSLRSLSKSGIRQAVADVVAKSQVKTLYLLSPDYLSPTFGYYTAQFPVQFHGFARWQHPELFSPQGYAKLWQSTTVSEAQKRIQVAAENLQQLALICETAVQDIGTMPYSKSNQLLSNLRADYPLLNQKEYPGINESVTLYQFELTADIK
jgi:uncharacterized membrane protein